VAALHRNCTLSPLSLPISGSIDREGLQRKYLLAVGYAMVATDGELPTRTLGKRRPFGRDAAICGGPTLSIHTLQGCEQRFGPGEAVQGCLGSASVDPLTAILG
jgi:hypothetical protein